MSEAAKLGELASVLRSKNAGPFQLTFDIFFDGIQDYDRVKRSGLINEGLIAELYRVPPEKVMNIVWHDSAKGLKITLARHVVSGGPGERDLYGCQQHAPLLDLEIP